MTSPRSHSWSPSSPSPRFQAIACSLHQNAKGFAGGMSGSNFTFRPTLKCWGEAAETDFPG